MTNEQLNLLCEKLYSDLLYSLDEEEIDRRLNDVRTRLGLLDQMLTLPGMSKIHKVVSIKGLLRDVFGVKGESWGI